jgi:hypothetical protein
MGFIIWGAIISGNIALIQWLFLRWKLKIGPGWIWKGILGACIAEVLIVLILLLFGIDRGGGLEFGKPVGMLIETGVYLFGGAITGYLQSGYFKAFSKNYRLWTIGSSFSWGVSTFLWTSTVCFIYDEANALIFFGGLFLGSFSAYFISTILSNSK